ncbi:MAG: hypothetical protein HYU66_21980, partial [Armatimonadetes bacterium]|nr:hypothetical protein [Armatimonadota bacterium]
MPAALLLFATAVQAAPLELFVATTGRDTWSGRLPAANAARTDGPFATPAHAQQEVRRLLAAGQLPAGVTVNLRAGTYELSKPLTLGPEDSGSADAPVVWRGYRDERPVLTGSRVVSGFRPFRDGILQADLKGTPLAGKAFRQLFFGGERMVMARYPNVDPADPHRGTWAFVADSDPAPATNNSVSDNVARTKDHFTATQDVIKPGWEHLARAEVCIHPAYGWAWSVVPVKAADRATGVVSLGKDVGYGIMVGDRYFVRGLLAELDVPGEWYLDPDSATLYFKPPADLAAGEVRAPVTDRLLVLEKAAHVTLRGFDLEACDGDAVRIQDCESCR